MAPTAAQLRSLITQTHRHAATVAAQIRALTAHLHQLRQVNARRRDQLAQMARRGVARRYGIDYTNLPPAQARALGATFVARYLSHDPSKNLTPTEARALRALGVDVVCVWETTATRALQGRLAGQADARQALAQAHTDGAPPTVVIYFAVDFDATGPDVDAYFDGVATVLGKGRCGPYGGIRVVKHLLDRGFVYAWQTYAWSGSPTQWDPRAQLQQFDNNNTRWDRDRSTRVDFGQWHPQP